MTLTGIASRISAAYSFEPDVDRASRALAAFRILLGLVVLWQAIMTARDLPLLISEYGLMQQPINEAMAPPFLPRLAWFHKFWDRGLITEHHLIYILLGLYLICLFFLIAGWRTRIFAAASLFFHLLFKASAASSSYGAHELSTNGLFFCILLPVSSYYTLARQSPAVDAFHVRLGRLVLRSYLSIVYVSSGVTKMLGPTWRNGEAMWQFLMRPEVTIMNFGWMSHVPWLLVAIGWFTLIVEAGYFLCLFSTRARVAWFFGTLFLHLGIAVTLHLWFFSLTMIAFNVGALSGFHWRWPRKATIPAGKLTEVA
ncbi:MAG TPA: hypothetical protein VHA33_25400 [Candidatus Angelobacter sp.]|jgi:hypothetical protein|nr:hypothetical protein [Candidatus Angelobacter sp.]